MPEPFDAAAMAEVDATIRSVFDPTDLITPDDVRGSHATLPEAIAADGWPTVGESRGKVMFLMDNGGSYRTTYLAGAPNLAGRPMFTNAVPGAADAAFIKRNDAHDPSIPDLVRDGYLVRTRADEPTDHARANDTTLRDAALASGAQFVSTDFPEPDFGIGFETDYWVQIPGGTVARCNPVLLPEGCVAADLDSPTTTTTSTTSSSSVASTTSTTSAGTATTASTGGTRGTIRGATGARAIGGSVRYTG